MKSVHRRGTEMNVKGRREKQAFGLFASSSPRALRFILLLDAVTP